MSDVGTAPAPGGVGPAPAPSTVTGGSSGWLGPGQSQIPIEPRGASSPNPIGSQAPQRQDAGEQPAGSRREAIQRAFAKSRDPEWQKNRPGPAEARKGHNQPPEETPDEKPDRGSDRFDLKKRPTDQAPQARGEGGRFAPRQREDGKPPQQGYAPQQQFGQQPPGQQQGVHTQPYRPDRNPLHPQAPYREPPQRMAEHAKAEWHAAPESVRGEVYRMHREFAAAHQRYRADHEAMNGLRPYFDLARRQGTSLDRVLGNYVGIEHRLRQDPIGGLDLIVNNLNLRTSDGHRLGLRDVAGYVLSQSPEQLRSVQHGNAQTAQSQQITQLSNLVRSLAQNQQRMQYADTYRQTRWGVDRFAETHPRLDELGDIIEQELKLGFNLPTAYRRAELLRPATHAAQTRHPSAQTRSDRSISGAPTSGGNAPRGPARRSDKPLPSRRETIADAIRRVNGSY